MNTNIARKAFLDLHNEHRAATAKGEVLIKNGKYARKCPMMKKLNYDCDLEKAAYATAQQCKPADPNTNNENWFTTKTTGTNKKAAAEKAVASWYEEISNGSMQQEEGSQNLLMPDLHVTHFARMVWSTNDRMGCAIHKCNKWCGLSVWPGESMSQD
ncbi:SCP-like protein [Ancylostoma duodenale]|uniref:SCP-like protein n=1 Tax=Ancylostoma duodenale TaxID=51022 RepID=A0A0C2CJR2_9BILA|nr:SCP-like protein [Ancylostoma duodenale]